MSKQNLLSPLFDAIKQNNKLVLRVYLYGVAIIIFLLALGISFALIADGILMSFIYLTIYIPLFRKWVAKMLKISSPEIQQVPPLNWFRLIRLVIYIGVHIGLIIFGVMFFINEGFLGQNLIYRFLHK